MGVQGLEPVAACLRGVVRPVGPVQGDDEISAQCVVTWVLGDQRPKVTDDLPVAAEQEVRGDPSLLDIAVQFIEALDVGGGKDVLGDVGEWLTAPQALSLL